MKLEITKIEIGERLRQVRQSAVEGIAASFASVGQLQAVLVRTDDKRTRLVAGAHRMAAAKKLGWAHIDTSPLDLSGMSKARADIVCKIAEVDENLSRNDLDYAERLLSVEARTLLTVERITLEKVEASTKAHEEALTRSDKDKAKKALNKAEKSAAKVSNTSSPAGVTSVRQVEGRIPNDVIAVVAKEIKVSAHTIHNVRATVKAVGTEALKTMSGTTLATKAEIEGLAKLQRLDPKQADDCMKWVAKAKAAGQEGKGAASGYSPSGRLGVIVKEQKAKDQHEASKTVEGCLKTMLEAASRISDMYEALQLACAQIPVPEIKSKYRDVAQVQQMHKAILTRLRQEARGPQQKITGTEHRYTVEKGEDKAAVRKSLGKDAKSIATKLRAKKPA